MKKRLLDYLCCPACQKEFTLKIKKEQDSEIESGKLICKECKKSYDIIDGVPVILDDKKLKDFSKTRKNWENWWKKVREKSDIDLYDKLWVQAEKNLGGEPLYKKSDFEGKVALDAGCGTGRYIESDFSKYNCKEIIAVDLGRQVFESKKNNNSTNTHFIQADLTNLPIKKEVLDVIASHGVLHHTPDPQYTFSRLSRHLKISGMMAVYVYHKEWAYFKTHKKSLFLDAMYANGVLIWQAIRKVVSRMPHFIIFIFVYIMAAKSTVEAKTGKFGKILRLIPPFAYIGVNFHERLVRNYDHYSATFNYFQTIDEVIDWFKKNNFNNLEIVSIPVSIRGIKQKKSQTPLLIKEYPLIEHFEFRKEWEKLYEKIKK